MRAGLAHLGHRPGPGRPAAARSRVRGSAAAARASLSSVLPFVLAFDFLCISGAQGSPSPGGAVSWPRGCSLGAGRDPFPGPNSWPCGRGSWDRGPGRAPHPHCHPARLWGSSNRPPGLEGHRELPANAANPGLSSHVSPEHFDSAKENQKLRHCKPNKKQPKSPGEWLSSSPDRCHTCSDSPFSWGRQAVCSSSFRKLPKAD